MTCVSASENTEGAREADVQLLLGGRQSQNRLGCRQLHLLCQHQARLQGNTCTRLWNCNVFVILMLQLLVFAVSEFYYILDITLSLTIAP